METQWIEEYKAAEEKAQSSLPFEEREIFVKYSDRDDVFLPKYESKVTSIDYENPDEEQVKITRFSEAMEIPAVIKKFKDKDKIQAFINSKLTSGIIITIKDDSEIKEPIKINSRPSENCAYKILVHAGKNSKASLIIDESSEKNIYFGQNTDIVTEENSDITLLSVQNFAGVTAKNYNISSAGNIEIIELLTSEGETRERIWMELLEHSEIKIKQSVIGNKDSYFDIETEINHAAKNTKSNVAYKAALADSSKSIYKGVILQGNTAYNSYAYLSESSLILSKDAKSISVPSLEIGHNELKAYHSASTEPINKNAVFYLMSRGLENNSAKMLITNGFLSQIFSEDTFGYEIINDKIMKKLNSMEF
jgi:Fe-S cluster assembly protein SufD